jgi:hypothetical protein
VRLPAPARVPAGTRAGGGRRAARAAGALARSALVAGALALVVVPRATAAQDLPRTGAERSGWERTTTHGEVLEFVYEIQARTDRMLVEELSVTNEGRSHVAVYLGDPPLAEPGASLLSGKPTVFIVASIHGNERSGKEGGLQLIRELTLGAERDLLARVNVIVVPHMNPDGGDAGRRTNSLGYDMNRDWIVAETREVDGVVSRILTRFWPDVFVDAHNGGAYPYHMTYQATLDPTADADLVAFARGPMYESVKGHLESRGMRMYWYSGPAHDPEAEAWYWRTTVPWPRKQHSYGGIQNMVTLLYEVPGRHPLEVQADAQREAMIGLLRFVAGNAEEVRRVVLDARRRTVDEPAAEVILELEEAAYPELEEFYVVERDESGAWREPRRVTGENRTLWRATRTRAAPEWGYAFDARLDDVATFLRRHGIQVERLREEVTLPGERYRIDRIAWSELPYQNHLMVERLDLEVVPAELTLPRGTYLVRLRQHAGRLIPQLLEPDAVDSVLRWNFLDHSIPTAGGDDRFVPIYRLDSRAEVATVLVP